MRTWPIPNVIETEIRLMHLAMFYDVQKPIAAADEPKLAHLQQWTDSERCQMVSTAIGEFRFQLFTCLRNLLPHFRGRELFYKSSP